MAKGKNTDDAEMDDVDAAESKKVGGKKGLMIAVIVLVLLLVGGAAAYFLVFNKKDEGKKPVAEESHEEGSEEAPAEGEHGGDEPAEESSGEHGEKPSGKAEKGPFYYEMPEFLVNLDSSGKHATFLKMKVTLELKKKADIKVVESYMPRITDSFNTYLRELRPTDLAGSAGMYRLREELMLRINQAIAPAQIENILFKEMLVQ
jgi:flagellar FliL protein